MINTSVHIYTGLYVYWIPDIERKTAITLISCNVNYLYLN